MNISFRKLENDDKDFNKLYNWCSNKNVYEWFEQRILSFEGIKKKYQKKLDEGKQELFIIKCDDIDIGLIQLYKYENDVSYKELDNYKNLYEFDIYIGNLDYVSKGIGSTIINLVKEKIYKEYNADAIILRPFERNIRAVKCYKKCGFEEVYKYEGTDSIGNKETILVLLNHK